MEPAAAANYRSYLVPGRDCGPCVACCTVPAIRSEEFNKPVGVACQNCVSGQGCAIYDSRPQLCRDYHCVWRSMPGLDDNWRPDISGVMVVWDSLAPEGATDAVDVIVTGDPVVLETDRFIGLIGGFIARGVSTRMSLPRGPGHLHVSILLNEPMAPIIAARDRAQARSLLRSAWQEMMKRPPVPEPALDNDVPEPALDSEHLPAAAAAAADQEESPDNYLVPGRECGTCTSCCTDLWIDDPVIQKPAGIACRHCTTGGGCAIYTERPQTCRSFHCLWRSLPNMGEEWRPDRSGILMMLADDSRDATSDGHCVDLVAVGGRAAIEKDDFAGLVAGFIQSGTLARLNVLPEGGMNSWQSPMNDLLAPAIASRDLAAIKAQIIALHDDLKARPVVDRAAEDTSI